jgi:hypothetical protein
MWKVMRVGTKSLLFGVHNVLWHPVTVYLAWHKLYGCPNLKETACIIMHDWGYWGCHNMDGLQGQKHPERAARIVKRLGWGEKYEKLCLLHSRSTAARFEEIPSKLCWADKLSIAYDPPMFYLFRARISGEIKEYRQESAMSCFCPLIATNREWLTLFRQYFMEQTYIGIEKQRKAALAADCAAAPAAKETPIISEQLRVETVVDSELLRIAEKYAIENVSDMNGDILDLSYFLIYDTLKISSLSVNRVSWNMSL